MATTATCIILINNHIMHTISNLQFSESQRLVWGWNDRAAISSTQIPQIQSRGQKYSTTHTTCNFCPDARERAGPVFPVFPPIPPPLSKTRARASRLLNLLLDPPHRRKHRPSALARVGTNAQLSFDFSGRNFYTILLSLEARSSMCNEVYIAAKSVVMGCI